MMILSLTCVLILKLVVQCTLILALLFCRMGSVNLLRSFPKFTKAYARAATDACPLDFEMMFL